MLELQFVSDTWPVIAGLYACIEYINDKQFALLLGIFVNIFSWS